MLGTLKRWGRANGAADGSAADSGHMVAEFAESSIAGDPRQA
jgi:hypothetical protein